MPNHPAITTLLPKGEGIGPHKAGAIGLVVRDFVQHSRFQNHQVLGSEDQPAFPEISYHCTDFSASFFRSRSYAYVREANQNIGGHGSNLLELHNRAIYVPWIKKAYPSLPLSFHLHNDPQSIRGLQSSKQRQEFLKKVERVYCVSAYLQSRFLEGVTDSQNKVCTIPIGLDLEVVKPSQQQREPVILFVGRVIPEKGALLFAQAAAQALQQLPASWRVEMIGASRFGASELKTAYEKQVYASLAPLGPRAQYHGYLPFEETLKRVQAAEIVCVPSQWDEPFGRTALEAMAAGAAVIATPYGGLKEVIDAAAMCIDSDKPQEFVAAMLTLAKDKALRKATQEQCRQRAEKYFNIFEHVAKLDAHRQSIFKVRR